MNRAHVLLLAFGLFACGSVAEEPTPPLANNGRVVDVTNGSGLFAAEQNGRWSIVRVDAASRSVTTLTPPMEGDGIDAFFASEDQRRFVVSVKRGTNGDGAIVAATADSTKVILPYDADHRALIGLRSGSLDFVELSRWNRGGGLIEHRIVDFDGEIVQAFGQQQRAVLIADALFVLADTSESSQAARWTVFDRGGVALQTLPSTYDSNAPAVFVDGRLVIQTGTTCSVLTPPSFAATSLRCDSLAPPWIRSGAQIARLAGGALEPAVTLPAGSTGELVHRSGALSTLVELRRSANQSVQRVTFVRDDGTKTTYDPGDPEAEGWSAIWTRAAGDGRRTCVAASASYCPRSAKESCTKGFVDLVCSDGTTPRSQRFVRDVPHDGRPPTGAVELTLSDDGSVLFYVDDKALHIVDTRTFADEKVGSTWSFGPREGDVPDVYGRSR